MKSSLSTLAAALLLLSAFDAQAVVCKQGVYRAGCASAGGAVVAPRPPPRAVVAPPRGAVVVPPRRGAVVVPPRGGAVVVPR